MADFSIYQLAVPFVVLLIAFLSYGSQYLFLYIEPAPLNTSELVKFNLLVACIWICYARACLTDPGRIPKDWNPPAAPGGLLEKHSNVEEGGDPSYRQRWCRRCEAYKPPRSHHCKTCQRCIPKMDHHCPWTYNCVSHFTFPHFIRFLFYAVISMMYLERFLYIRIAVIWNNRNLPSYYGPSLAQLGLLFTLAVVNTIVLLALLILFLRNIWTLGANETTIEGWEIERHKTLCRRARALGGYLEGPNGIKVYIKRQEFPYDIGIWNNIRDGMGGSNNIFGWFWPFSRTPDRRTGLEFEVNGFEDESLTWPPPDPDRMARSMPPGEHDTTLLGEGQNFTYDEVEAFRLRQEADYLRQRGGKNVRRRKPFHKRYTKKGDDAHLSSVSDLDDEESSNSGEEGWRNSEGERLKDFGVDEEVEFYDEDDIPLAELIRRRRLQS
ncbi:Palmitoyltransferase PFA4 [Trichophyton interdigitale]|nr:Palmitoyltransferase PFA4 [Trichophyton interdigitale]KAG5218760.1 Palmitoyltransferase PFA4 [Trichophyton interdigitale]KAG8207450.1 Palmitoyltransferase PFA4 [Trichophyton interdigitale]